MQGERRGPGQLALLLVLPGLQGVLEGLGHGARITHAPASARPTANAVGDSRNEPRMGTQTPVYSGAEGTALGISAPFTSSGGEICQFLESNAQAPGPPSRQAPSYPIPGEGLRPVLVDDADVPRGLDPGLSVHLHRHALIAQDGDLHRATLRRPQPARAPSRPGATQGQRAALPHSPPRARRLTSRASGLRGSPPGAQLLEPRAGPALPCRPAPRAPRVRDRCLVGNSVLRCQHRTLGGDMARAAESLGTWGPTRDEANSHRGVLFSTESIAEALKP